MRFRRHVPERRRFLDWLKGVFPRRREPSRAARSNDREVALQVDASESTGGDATFPSRYPEPVAASPPAPTDPRPSAPVEAPEDTKEDRPPTISGWPTLADVRVLVRRHRTGVVVGSTFAGTFLLGYLVAALVLFPAPIFAATKSVPRLIGLARAEAESRLESDGLLLGDIHGVTHPSAARGQIVWQDPPTGVGVPEGTLVELTVSNGPQRTPVPDLLGYDATIARQLLEASGLRVGRVDSTQAPVPQGVVVSTRPSTGSTILPGSAVTLVVSVGAPTITVPDLTGLTREEAETVLQQVGLSLGTTARRASGSVPPGTIVQQNPRSGTLSAPGTAVDIFIARAPSR